MKQGRELSLTRCSYELTEFCFSRVRTTPWNWIQHTSFRASLSFPHAVERALEVNQLFIRQPAAVKWQATAPKGEVMAQRRIPSKRYVVHRQAYR